MLAVSPLMFLRHPISYPLTPHQCPGEHRAAELPGRQRQEVDFIPHTWRCLSLANSKIYKTVLGMTRRPCWCRRFAGCLWPPRKKGLELRLHSQNPVPSHPGPADVGIWGPDREQLPSSSLLFSLGAQLFLLRKTRSL